MSADMHSNPSCTARDAFLPKKTVNAGQIALTDYRAAWKQRLELLATLQLKADAQAALFGSKLKNNAQGSRDATPTTVRAGKGDEAKPPEPTPAGVAAPGGGGSADARKSPGPRRR